jgi:hypothetical protein
MVAWLQILGGWAARTSVTGMRVLTLPSPPSDFGFNTQRAVGWGPEAGHWTRTWPSGSGWLLARMAKRLRSVIRA